MNLAEFILKRMDATLNDIYTDIKKRLEKADYMISPAKDIDYGIQFTIQKVLWNGTLRIYQNKKGIVKYDFSQIKDDKKKDEIISLIEQTTDTNTLNLNTETIGLDFFTPIIGTDESGKGDYFGPLVAAAVYVDNKSKSILERSGIRDSKTITDNKIPDLARIIKSNCLNQFVVIEISPETYNNLYDSFKNENKNLNFLLAWAHAKAIEEILKKVECENVLSDKFGDDKYILSKLQEKGKKINLRQEHKAESNIAVAAASILARERFLDKLSKLSAEYNMHLSKGASIQVITEAKDIFMKFGLEGLKRVAKIHFKTTEQVIH
jgi:ribonuclease HIII